MLWNFIRLPRQLSELICIFNLIVCRRESPQQVFPHCRVIIKVKKRHNRGERKMIAECHYRFNMLISHGSERVNTWNFILYTISRQHFAREVCSWKSIFRPWTNPPTWNKLVTHMKHEWDLSQFSTWTHSRFSIESIESNFIVMKCLSGPLFIPHTQTARRHNDRPRNREITGKSINRYKQLLQHNFRK